MTTYINTDALSLWDEHIFRQHLGTIATPVAPRTSPHDPDADAVIDVTPETRGDRAVVAHINTWKANRNRNATPRDMPEPPEAA